MAFFGLFGKKDPEVEARRLAKAASQKFGPAENRQKALEDLRDLRAPAGWAAMLQRFTFIVEPQITDSEEKTFVCQALVDVGEPVVPVIKQFIEKNEAVAWGIKALSQVVSQEELVETLLAVLEKEGPEYTRDPEKKITLVRSLEEHDDDRIAPRLVPFFEDISEDVRFSAIAAATRKPVEAVREPLLATLLKATEEKSDRIRIACAQALARTAFSVKGQTPAIEAALPTGFTLDKNGVVKAK